MKIFKFAVAPLIIVLGLLGTLFGQEIEARVSFKSQAMAALSGATNSYRIKSEYRELKYTDLDLKGALNQEEINVILREKGYSVLSESWTVCVMGSQKCEGYDGEAVYEKQTNKTTLLSLNYDFKPHGDDCKINFRNIIEVDVERN